MHKAPAIAHPASHNTFSGTSSSTAKQNKEADETLFGSAMSSVRDARRVCGWRSTASSRPAA